MAGKKITQLPFAFAAALTDILPEVQGGVTKQVNLQQISNLFGFSTGVLTPTYGGTGVSDPTAHTIPIAEGSADFNFVGPLTNGQLLIGSTGVDPVAASITAGTGITVTPGAGSITIAATGGAVNAGTINELAYYAATGSTVSGLATANNGTLVTSAGGVPSISSTLPSAVQTNITALGAQAQALNMNSHLINNVTDPVSPQDAATKNYTDMLALGLNILAAAYAASTTALTVTYNNGASGVGATLTNAGVQATFALDSVSPPLNSRVLIKNQASSLQNGVYTVTDVGSGATNWVLTRATDYDSSAEITPGDFILIDFGTVNTATAWIQTATVTTVGTDPITFSQFGATLPLSLANGGTGASLTANNGGIFYSTASAGAILAGTATAGKVLQSGATAAPSWSTPTYPSASGSAGQILRSDGTNNVYTTSTFADTYTASNLLYSNGANTVTGLATANNGVLVTSGTGVPSISSTLPAFTTSSITFSPTTGGIVGTTTNDNVAAGKVGEFVSSVVAVASAVSCTSPTARDITSISLTAGDWDLWGNTGFAVSGGATALAGWISSTSATLPDGSLISTITAAAIASNTFCVPYVRMSLSGTTTIYLSCRAVFGAGTVTAFGGIFARRVR